MVGKSINSSGIRKFVQRLPGGRVKITKSRRKTSKLVCSVTGEQLRGVPRIKINKVEKSRRAPNRPYGGVLSSRASRSIFINKAREENA